MEFSDVAPNIVFASVTQQIQLSLIGSKNPAVRTHPMERDGAVVEEILEIALTQAELIFQHATIANVGEAADGADKESAIVKQRIDADENGKPLPIEPLNDDFPIPNRRRSRERLGHRGLSVRKRLAVHAKESMRTAKLVGLIFAARMTSPQLFRTPVIANYAA
jgi:hypothetical protein